MCWNSTINYRLHSNLYCIGHGEQGVLTCQPYKSEICRFWRFRTPEIAKDSAKKIYEMFLEYLSCRDFPGADMARKFLQMGYTRSRRYANHRSGIKYGKDGSVLPLDPDPIKSQSAEIFRLYYNKTLHNKEYLLQKVHHQSIYVSCSKRC